MGVFQITLSYDNAIMWQYVNLVKWKYGHMSPRPIHIPKNARQTSLSLTAEERFALDWIKAVRENRRDDRKTLNDILVDGLWLLAAKEGKTKQEIFAMLPPSSDQVIQGKVTEMPKNPSRTRAK
jgi:hypothetical protein